MFTKKICMLGYYGVGKTSLMRRFVHSMFSDDYHTTVGVKVEKKVLEVDGRKGTLMVWDIAGKEDERQVDLSNARAALGYLLVADGCRAKTLDAAGQSQQRVENEIGRMPFVLLLNKADERHDWEVTEASLQELSGRGWKILETSAKTGQNVEEAFRSLTITILQAQDEGEDDD